MEQIVFILNIMLLNKLFVKTKQSVYNLSMDKIKRHAKLIDDLGGPAFVADLLGYDKSKGGTQRVYNWKSRGIPSHVLLNYSNIFNKLKEVA